MERKIKIKARTDDEKAEQYERILDVGIELFIKRGGFSMRQLARELGMSEAFMYNYFSSKRELWIGIRKRYFSQYQDGLQKLYDKYESNVIQFFLNWVEFFLEFAASDYNRFKMMFLINAPKSRKIGPLEKNYKRFNLFESGFKRINEVLEKNKLKMPKIEPLVYFIFSLIFGVAKIEADLKLRYDITEPLIPSEEKKITREELREFTAIKVKEIIENELRKYNPDYK